MNFREQILEQVPVKRGYRDQLPLNPCFPRTQCSHSENLFGNGRCTWSDLHLNFTRPSMQCRDNHLVMIGQNTSNRCCSVATGRLRIRSCALSARLWTWNHQIALSISVKLTLCSFRSNFQIQNKNPIHRNLCANNLSVSRFTLMLKWWESYGQITSFGYWMFR